MHLVKYILILFVAAILFTASLTWLANAGLRRSGVDFYGKINAARHTEHQTNLMLVGSSRVLKHLDPKIIDSATGLNSFNYGLNSGTIKTWFNIIKYALEYQKNVKIIVLNVDYNMFDISKDPYKDAYYYPFNFQTQGVEMNGSDKISMIHKAKLFDISLYDDYAKYAAIDGWLRPGRVVQGVYKGYYPNTQVNNFESIPGFEKFKKETILYPDSGVQLLKNCIQLCKQNNIKLVLVLAPYYEEYSPEKHIANFSTIINNVKDVAKKSEIPFYDYTHMSIASDQQYFYNVNHLNSKGSSLYTLAMVDSLKQYLSVNN